MFYIKETASVKLRVTQKVTQRLQGCNPEPKRASVQGPCQGQHTISRELISGALADACRFFCFLGLVLFCFLVSVLNSQTTTSFVDFFNSRNS